LDTIIIIKAKWYNYKHINYVIDIIDLNK